LSVASSPVSNSTFTFSVQYFFTLASSFSACSFVPNEVQIFEMEAFSPVVPARTTYSIDSFAFNFLRSNLNAPTASFPSRWQPAVHPVFSTRTASGIRKEPPSPIKLSTVG